MIANAILYLIYLFVAGIASLLSSTSDVKANSSITAAITTASGYLHVVYSILPTTTVALLACVSLLLVFESALAIYKIVRWGYQKIPGIT